MKKIIRLIIVISLLSLLSGCAYYSKMAVPGEPAQQGKYEIIKHIKTSVTGTRFLMIPINIPSSAQIIKNEVALLGGDGIINVETTFSEFNLFVLSFPIVEVEGDVVKIVAQIPEPSTLQQEPSGQVVQPSQARKYQPESEEFYKWKKKIAQYLKDDSYNWRWKSYVKRNSITISLEDWVKSLPESEYQQYLSSGMSFDKWLQKKLKE